MKIIANDSNNNPKRVRSLLRVSSKRQVSKQKNDIPLQRDKCREFATTKPEWIITYEYEEKGVSGYKKTAAQRDIIQKVKKDVLNGEFDVLLLFHSDRLGRLEDDTLDLLKWFLRHGIEIWSVKEGEIRNDNLGDKLINVVRFATAQQESEKISYRVSSRKAQLVKEGVFTGGVIPFGYKKVKKGRLDKKGRELYDLGIDEMERQIVVDIFDWYVHKGYGTGTIATMLNEKGIRTHNGAKFQCNTINRILSNVNTIGHFKNNDILSIYLPELHIIDKHVFEKAQKIKKQRADKKNMESRCAMESGSAALLSGNIFCGHCGSRINAYKKDGKYKMASGEIRSYGYSTYYYCTHRRKNLDCCGQSVYLASKIDSVMIKLLGIMFQEIKKTPKELIIEKRFNDRIRFLQKQCDKAKRELEKEKDAIKVLKSEIVSAIKGDSTFTPAELKEVIDDRKEIIAGYELALEEAEHELENEQVTYNSLEPKYNEFISWAVEFPTMGLEEQKVIANRLIKKVSINKGYEIDVKFNMDYAQFCVNFEAKQIKCA